MFNLIKEINSILDIEIEARRRKTLPIESQLTLLSEEEKLVDIDLFWVENLFDELLKIEPDFPTNLK